MSNYPPGFNPIRHVHLELICSKCDNQWEVDALEELGALVDDEVVICPECGWDTNEIYDDDGDDDEIED